MVFTTLKSCVIQLLLFFNILLVILSWFLSSFETAGENQYVDFGLQTDSCFGNLDICHHGSMLSFWIDFETFEPLQYIMSAPAYNVFVNNRRQLTAIYSTDKKVWTVTTPDRFEPNRWYERFLLICGKNLMCLQYNFEIIIYLCILYRLFGWQDM